MLTRFFLGKFAAPGIELTPEALAALCVHAWPGNVRQLENELRRGTTPDPRAHRVGGLVAGDAGFAALAAQFSLQVVSEPSHPATPADVPARVATLAMNHHGLGHQAEAHAKLGRLRALLQREEFQSYLSQSFLHEAEESILGSGSPRKAE